MGKVYEKEVPVKKLPRTGYQIVEGVFELSLNFIIKKQNKKIQERLAIQ